MTYSEEEMAEIETDPVRLRAYFWRVAMSAKLRSMKRPEVINDTTIHWQGVDARFSQVILENLDALVESTVKTP